MPSHRLVKRAQEVLVELLLCIPVQLVVLLEEGLLRANLRQNAVLIVAGRGDATTFVPASVSRRHSFDLFDDRCPWVDLVDHGEEAREFGPMSREYLKLFD